MSNKLKLTLLGLLLASTAFATGSNINYTGTFLPTRNDFWEIGTSTSEYLNGFFKNVTVSGTCSGCSAASTVLLQQTYDNTTGSAAELRLANSKDLIFSLQNTTVDPNFVINFESSSNGQFLIQSASTTKALFTRDGSFGIGTTSPGGGLAVGISTTTILDGDAYVYGQLNIPNLNSTTTNASFFAGDIGSSARRVPNIYAGNLDTTLLAVGGYTQGGLVVNGALTVSGTNFSLGTGLATSTYVANATSTMQAGFVFATGGIQVTAGGLNLSSGVDVLLNGKITDASSATNTLPNVNASTLSVGAKFYGSGTATSSYEGGIQIKGNGGLTTLSGLTITGDELLNGKFVDSNAATSSFTGTLTISGLTQTTQAVTQGACKTVSFASTMTVDWYQANCFALGQLTSSPKIVFTQISSAFQNISVEIFSSNATFQPSWTGSAGGSTSPNIIWLNGSYGNKSTTTPGQIHEGLNRCQFTSTSTPNSIEGICL